VEEVKAAAPVTPVPDAVKPPADNHNGARPGAVPAIAPKLQPLIPATAPEEVAIPPLASTAAFFVHARAQMDMMRDLVEMIRNTPGRGVQQEMITDLLLGVHLLVANAEESGQHSIALMASALEGLLKKLRENAANLSASTLQAVAAAAALIQDLCKVEPSPDLAIAPPIRALVVDDDPVSLRAVSGALQMRFSKPESASDGKCAMALAAEKPFDVIFLDVQMPDFDGFEVCARIHENPVNHRTPVVFLTNHNAPDMRDKSEACGGSDFLDKSCLGSELTLKALSFALRRRLQNTWGAVPQNVN
jgi:CheY-like chemotaxis protein